MRKHRKFKEERNIKIRELRQRAGLTQAEVAVEMNVDQSAVSRWESGECRPCRKYHKQLAELLHCEVEEIKEACG